MRVKIAPKTRQRDSQWVTLEEWELIRKHPQGRNMIELDRDSKPIVLPHARPIEPKEVKEKKKKPEASPEPSQKTGD